MTILIVESDEETATRLASTISEPVEVSPSFPTGEPGATSASTVVVGPTVPTRSVLAMAARVQETAQPARMIWVRDDLDTDVVLAAMRAGMTDVVVDLTDLDSAVLRAHTATPTERRSRGKVVCVFAPKGGDGKTTVSTALASVLQQRARTVILDLDLEFGDVAMTMCVTPHHTIADVGQLDGALDATGVEALLTTATNGVKVLAAPPTPERAAAVSARDTKDLIDVLTTMFDVVIVDCPPSVSPHVLATWDSTDEMVIVTLPVITSLRCATAALTPMRTLKIDERANMRLVVNRHDISPETTVKDVETALGLQAVAALPQANDVSVALNRGDIFTDAHPAHPLTKAILNLASTVYPPPSNTDLAPARPARRRLFTRKKVAQ